MSQKDIKSQIQLKIYTAYGEEVYYVLQTTSRIFVIDWAVFSG